MPTTAQDRNRGGPLAALLILLSLFLTSATATAVSYDFQAPASRLGSSRQGAATALLPPGARNPLDDETSGGGTSPSLLSSGPDIVTERLWARPRSDAESSALDQVQQPASAPYRARAPPAPRPAALRPIGTELQLEIIMSSATYRLTHIHRRLDEAIASEASRRLPDSLKLLRLKKLRLAVKDRLATLMRGSIAA